MEDPQYICALRNIIFNGSNSDLSIKYIEKILSVIKIDEDDEYVEILKQNVSVCDFYNFLILYLQNYYNENITQITPNNKLFLYRQIIGENYVIEPICPNRELLEL